MVCLFGLIPLAISCFIRAWYVLIIYYYILVFIGYAKIEFLSTSHIIIRYLCHTQEVTGKFLV